MRKKTNPDQEIIEEINAEPLNEIVTLRTGGGVLDSVTTDTSVETNSKTEFKVAVSNPQGNVYDSDRVDCYAEIIDPDDNLKYVPAFWTQDYTVEFDPWDVTQETSFSGSEAWTPNASVKAVLDYNDTGKSVARIALASGGNVYRSFSVTGDTVDGTDRVFFYIKNTGGSDISNLAVEFSNNGTNAVSYNIGSQGLVTNEWTKISIPYEDFASGFSPDSKNRLTFRGTGTFMVSDLGVERILAPSGMAINVSVIISFKHTNFNKFYAGDNWNGSEVTTLAGAPYFCVRYNAQTPGTYLYRVTYKENNMTVATYTSTFTAVNKESKGLIKVESSLKRNFVYEDGDSFMPVGMNIGWYGELNKSSDKATYEYYNYFERMNGSGMNWARLWLGHWQFSLHSNEGGILRFDPRLIEAARFDSVLEKASEEGVYIALCLLIHGAFVSGSDGWQSWHTNPFNEANGGYIDRNNPIEFLSSQRAINDFKKITRYTLARWGYSENIFAWELWNEITHVKGLGDNVETAKAWHSEMTRFIKTNDQLPHMVTTSGHLIDAPVYDKDDNMDYTNSHNYGGTYGNAVITSQKDMYTRYKKPVMFSEIGPSGNNNVENFAADPTGLYLLQGSWSGAMGYGGGGAMTWWWEAVHERNLYYRYEAVTGYFALTDADYASMPSIEPGTNSPDYTIEGSGTNALRTAGYKTANKAYAYVYNSAWNNAGSANPAFSGASVTLKNMDAGNYTVILYDATEGRVLDTLSKTASGGTLKVELSSFQRHIALIIKKV